MNQKRQYKAFEEDNIALDIDQEDTAPDAAQPLWVRTNTHHNLLQSN